MKEIKVKRFKRIERKYVEFDEYLKKKWKTSFVNSFDEKERLL